MDRTTKATRTQEWLRLAYKHLATARMVQRQGDLYADIACFHAAQSVEKALKGYLFWLEEARPEADGIDTLLGRLDRSDALLARCPDDLALLTRHADALDAPDPGARSAEEAQAATQQARQVFRAALKRVLELRKEPTSSPSSPLAASSTRAA